MSFYSAKYNLEGDISVCNTLALRNTTLLYKYSMIDERVRTLGYAVKELAKVGSSFMRSCFIFKIIAVLSTQ